jgi:hypothetical protein
LERFPTRKVTVFPQHVVIGEALVHHGVPLAAGHRVPLLVFHVSKTDVFHRFSCSCLMMNGLLTPYSRLTEPKIDNEAKGDS